MNQRLLSTFCALSVVVVASCMLFNNCCEFREFFVVVILFFSILLPICWPAIVVLIDFMEIFRLEINSFCYYFTIFAHFLLIYPQILQLLKNKKKNSPFSQH